MDNALWIKWNDYDYKLAQVRKEAASLYDSATEAGMLPKTLRLKDFTDIGIKLLEASTKHTGPTKQAIRSISQGTFISIFLALAQIADATPVPER